ncbi:SAM-dependent methyltransferase [Paramuricea clavata]|uniref:SAM-dependent methyltransferase n=1 Tax=Paramuricea clavata TaxID=317549 RepID=A0A6S7GRA7_PARCT|nr:SAM-dependent methyltransferase [Paramuricea clavata]
MCEKFKEMVPNVEILQCPASDLDGLTNNSVDCILAATSFHWFCKDQKAIEEIHRVLKPKAMLGLIWYVPDRSVSWIKNIEEMLDPKYKVPKFGISNYGETVLIPLQDHGGFVNEGSDVTSYTYRLELNLTDVIEMYKGKSIIAAAQGAEKELMLQAIEQEMKTNPETKNEEKYIFKFVKKLHWFQKI